MTRDPSDSAEALYRKGRDCFNQEGDLHKAKQEFTRAIQCDRRYVPAYEALAECFRAEGLTEMAEGCLRQGLEMAPTHPGLNGTLGSFLKEAGKLDEAALLLKRALRWESNRKWALHWERLLRTFPEGNGADERTGWHMARGSAGRCSTVEGESSPLRFHQRWPKPFRFFRPLEQENVMSIPSPVILGNTVIVADCSAGAFVGLDIRSGSKVWSSGRLMETLDYSNSPIIVQNRMLLIATRSGLLGAVMDAETVDLRDLVTDERIQLSTISTPLAFEELGVFCFKRHLLIYDSLLHQCHFVDLELEDGDAPLSPALFGRRLLVLSRKGRLYEVDINAFARERVLRGKHMVEGICSPPVVSGKYAYFECFETEREVCAYDPADGSLVRHRLANEHCSPRHVHFHFPGIAYTDGAFFSSDVDMPPRFHGVRRRGNDLTIVNIDVEISSGSQQVFGVSHVFTVMVQDYLVSKTGQGFFYLSLHDPRERGMVFLQGEETIAQPVVDQGNLVLVCREGIRCYSLYGAKGKD